MCINFTMLVLLLCFVPSHIVDPFTMGLALADTLKIAPNLLLAPGWSENNLWLTEAV